MKLLCVFFVFFIPMTAMSLEKKLIFGIAPQQSANLLIESWSPLIEKIKQDCDCLVQFATAPSIAEFEQKVESGEYDLVYLNPLHFINAQKIGYTSLVREEGRKLKGIIVVKKESAIKELSDLNGKKIAFPGETAFAATILVQKKFEQAKLDIESIYVKSHDSVYQNVISGLMDAGGGVNRTFDSLTESDKNKLRILETTNSVTPHPIAIKKQVPKVLRNKILQTLVNLKNSTEGKVILEKLDLKSLVESKDSDWDDVRALTRKFKLN
jgi:phosphonate transport system substrate-binding protein